MVVEFVVRRKSHRWRRLFPAGTILLCLAACSKDSDRPLVPEPAEEPGTVSVHRLSWSLASVSADPLAGGEEGRTFTAQDRVGTIRWFMVTPLVLRRYLDPEVETAERETPVPTMELYLRSETGIWGPTSWGGIMCSPAVTGVGFPDMTDMAWFDIWINDGAPDPAARSGRLHVDFGRLDEDGFWPVDYEGLLVTDRFEQEDGIVSGNPDGIWTYEEDIGLGGRDYEPYLYNADYTIAGDSPYPQINNTARNNREDTEDIDNNGQWDRVNSYFTYVIDLATTTPIIDVVRDYDDTQDLIAAGIAWRLYQIPIRRSVAVVDASGTPDLANVRHMRIWLEDPAHPEAPIRRLQIAGMHFH